MRVYLLFILQFLVLGTNYAQTPTITKLGNGLEPSPIYPRPYCMLFDSISNRVYVGGQLIIKTDTGYTIRGISYYDNGAWQAMKGGIDYWGNAWDSTSGTLGAFAIVRYKNSLYTCGDYDRVDTVKSGGISRWDGNNWYRTVETRSITNNGNDTDYYVDQLRVMGDYLYAFGLFDTVNGERIGQAIRYDGDKWERVASKNVVSTIDGSYEWISRALDGIYFKNEFYFAGNFQLQGGAVMDIAKWDTSLQKWTGIGPTGSLSLNTGGGMGAVTALCEYNGDLYIGGGFIEQANGQPTNCILRFDGTKYYEVGGGIQYGGIRKMHIHKGKLYVCGNFLGVGNLPNARLIAAWDGNKWEDFGITSQSSGVMIADFCFNGEDLYVCGDFTDLNGVVCNGVAKINIVTGIVDPLNNIQAISVYPNPVINDLHINNTSNQIVKFELYNMIGQRIHLGVLQPLVNMKIEMSVFPKGMYIVKYNDGIKLHAERIVKN